MVHPYVRITIDYCMRNGVIINMNYLISKKFKNRSFVYTKTCTNFVNTAVSG